MLNPLVVLSNVIGATPVINILSTTVSVPFFSISYHFLIFPFPDNISLKSSVLKPSSSLAKWSYSSIITYIFFPALCMLNALKKLLKIFSASSSKFV